MSGNGTVGAVAETVNVLMGALNVLIRCSNEYVDGFPSCGGWCIIDVGAVVRPGKRHGCLNDRA